MQYVYVLQSKKDGDLYTGCTKDLKRRFELHNAKKVPATARRTPLRLIYYEAYLNMYDAYKRESYLKTQWGRNYLKKTLKNFFNS
ncbi:MAG: GIY-YIG nuclease family protein [Candidatus Pacebacteria bacterium]|nr:GIY-YIG nuclease family protein [Candidatus Paceibacterota bacterium]